MSLMNGAKSRPKSGEADVIDLTGDISPRLWSPQIREGTRGKRVLETIDLLDDDDDDDGSSSFSARKQMPGQNEPSFPKSQRTSFLAEASRQNPGDTHPFSDHIASYSRLPASGTVNLQKVVQTPRFSMNNPLSANSSSQAPRVQTNQEWHAEQMRSIRLMENRNNTAPIAIQANVHTARSISRESEALRQRLSDSVDPKAVQNQSTQKPQIASSTKATSALRNGTASLAVNITPSEHGLLPENASNTKRRIGYEYAQLPTPFRAATESANLAKSADVSKFFGANARRAASERASSRSPVPPASRCGACIDFHLACDGQQPCSRCVEFSASCEYDQTPSPAQAAVQESRSELPQALVSKQSEVLPEASHTAKALQIEVINSSDGKRPESSPNVVQHEPVQALVASLTLPVDLPKGLATPPPAKQIVLELEVIDAALAEHCRYMDGHRQDVVEGLLQDARLQMTTTPLASLIPNLTTRHSDPFHQLLSKPAQNPTIAFARSAVYLEIKTRCFGASAARGSNLRTETVAMQAFCTTSSTIPRYKSVGLTRQNLIARNVKTYKYVPYFQEHESSNANQERRDTEIKEQYARTKDALKEQRACREIANTWRPYLEGLLNDYAISPLAIHDYTMTAQDYFTGMDLSETMIRCCENGQLCRQCENEAGFPSQPLATMINAVLDTRSLILAGAFSNYLCERAGSSLLHIMSESQGMKGLYRRYKAMTSISPTTKLDSLCLVCYRHFCTSHGPFLEDDDLTTVREENCVEMSNEHGPEGSTGEGIEDVAGGRIDDCEAVNNKRLYVSLPERKRNLELHNCGTFCADPETLIHDLFGRHKDGQLGGSSYCETVISDSDIFRDEDSCSESCFWNVNKRNPVLSMIRDVKTNSLKELTRHQSDQLRSMVLVLSNHQRAPCLIAMGIEQISCLDIFYHLIQSTNAIAHPSASEELQRPVLRQARSHTNRTYPPMTSMIHERPPFVPCSHEGSCKPGQQCSCMDSKVACEWYCGCDEFCSRRFRGCDCRAGDGRVCFEDARCECWQHSRECDPHLCGDCGVTEVLEPSNRYLENTREGRCRNNRLQLNLPRRTLKGSSEVHGWGLFAGENLKKGDFIGEYKGETVSGPESDRRGLVYHNIELEYLFLINQHQQIDGSNVGNKMRLMNNSQLKEHINVTPMKLLCNGVPRVMLCAARDIQAGEEMLYKYGYEDEVTMKFWEKGEKPKDGTSNGTNPTSKTKNKHSQKLGGTTSTSDMKVSPLRSLGTSSKGVSEDGSSPVIGRKRKRKRISSTEMNGSATNIVPRDEVRDHIAASSSDVKVISDTNGSGSDYGATEDSMKESSSPDQSDAEISDSERSGRRPGR